MGNEWMRQPVMPSSVDALYDQTRRERPSVNIIDVLSKLIRYNKKYDIVMVPSSVCLRSEWLESIAVNRFACHLDAIEKRRCSFMYKGCLFGYTVGKKEDSDDEKEEEHSDEFFLDEIKTLVRKIRENIIENAIDWMDPIDTTIKDRMRGRIKRNNRDTELRWLQIGCGSCFLQSSMGKQTEIGPPVSQDYDKE